ncbi:Phospholipase D1, partial [Operophtera brumata]
MAGPEDVFGAMRPLNKKNCPPPTLLRHIDQYWSPETKSYSLPARDFTHPNVHYSFAPNRGATPAATFVDGSAYLSAAADAMELAREEIFIADWWLSPEIYLKRPALNGNYWRLDTLLKRKAAQGVKIFVMLYKEVEMALGINSFYSKSRLANEYIKVFRHPDHAKAGVLFWAHHEKIVLTDLGNVAQPKNSLRMKMKTSSSPNGGLYLPNLNGLQATIELAKSSKDLVISLNDIQENIDTQETKSDTPQTETETENVTQPNLPQLEPGDQLLITTPTNPTQEFSIFETPDVPKRNVLNKITNRGKDIISIIYPPFEEDRIEQKFDDSERKKAEKYALSNDQVLLTDAFGTKDIKVKRNVSEPTPLAQVVEGRVITESTKDALENVEGNSKLYCLVISDLVDRHSTPRMPWHDIGVMVQNAAARDVARHFIQRWNAIKLEKYRQNTNYPYLLPKSYADMKPLQDLNRTLNVDINNVSCQVIRSVSSWSCGFLDPDTVEQSIHNSSRDAIITRLYESGVPDPSEYITFHGLRTHSALGTEPVTELIYVHSKLLIADDKSDEQFTDGAMAGETFPCGRVAGALRKRLFREHLGLMEADLECAGVSLDDPCCDHFYRNVWKATSKQNTDVYEE